MTRPRHHTPPESPIALRLAKEKVRHVEICQRSLNVLVVDDDELVMDLVSRLLRIHGFTVHATTCALAALTIWKENAGRFDLVITDVIMPGMTGPQLAANLAEAEENVEILFMSGSALATELEAEPWFVAKPFTAECLMAKIRRAIQGGSGWRTRSALQP